MLYAGTLPHAELYRYDGDDDWALLGSLDETRDVLYRRAASMVVFGGELFVGTLPSGHVYSLRAGAVATCDRSLSAGWHHLAGVRSETRVTLVVDGVAVGTGQMVGPGASFERGPGVPLIIGGGPRASFEGDLSAVRLWDRALDPNEIRVLAR